MNSLHLLLAMVLVSKRNVMAKCHFTGFRTKMNLTWNFWYENNAWRKHSGLEMPSCKWNGSSTAHPQTWTWRTSWSFRDNSVLSFFISCKAEMTEVLYFNKVPPFFLLLWESGRSPADRFDRTPVERREEASLFCCEPSRSTWDKQTERQTGR